jgi:tetratricopeptide (TPR) repeat protein
MTQMGKNLAADSSNIINDLVSEPAKKLSQAKNNLDLVYHKLLHPLTLNQYQDLEQIFPTIAQLSELNLVYLMFKQGEGIQSKPKFSATAKTTQSPREKKTEAQVEPSVSPVIPYLQRAQDYLNRNNPSQAISELREALKLEPKNSSCHGLLGLAYLQQKQVSMARIHIEQAWKYNPRDPIAQEAKQELDQKFPSETKRKSSSEQSGSGGLFGSLFSGKKK